MIADSDAYDLSSPGASTSTSQRIYGDLMRKYRKDFLSHFSRACFLFRQEAESGEMYQGALLLLGDGCAAARTQLDAIGGREQLRLHV